jgi:hypothetical protein
MKFWLENVKERDHLRDLDINGITIKLNLWLVCASCGLGYVHCQF